MFDLLGQCLVEHKESAKMFDLFNLNDKGYLTESEISLMILSVARVVKKLIPSGQYQPSQRYM